MGNCCVSLHGFVQSGGISAGHVYAQKTGFRTSLKRYLVLRWQSQDQDIKDVDVSKWFLIYFESADFPKPLKFVSINRQGADQCEAIERWQDEDGKVYEVLRKDWTRSYPRELSAEEVAAPPPPAPEVVKEAEPLALRVPVAFLAHMLNTTISGAQRKFCVKGDMGLDDLKVWIEKHAGSGNHQRWVEMVEKMEMKLIAEHEKAKQVQQPK